MDSCRAGTLLIDNDNSDGNSDDDGDEEEDDNDNYDSPRHGRIGG